MHETTNPQNPSKESDERFQAKVSIGIAAIAAMLLINDLGSQNTSWDATHQNTIAINTYAFFQAKTIRQNDLNLTADTLEAIAKTSLPSIPIQAKRDVLALAQTHREKALTYDSDPATGEGRKELIEKAEAAAAVRDKAIAKGPYYDFAALLLQMSIILLSVVLITRRGTLLIAGVVTALIGTFLSLNAFTGLVSIPGIG